MNIHLPAILGFTRVQGFDPHPCGGMEDDNMMGWIWGKNAGESPKCQRLIIIFPKRATF
jgi:hypothetical protein